MENHYRYGSLKGAISGFGTRKLVLKSLFNITVKALYEDL
jgi:hypothetical protein